MVLLAAASVVLDGFIRQLTLLNVGPAAPVIAIYAVVGVVVARRQPRNPIGWILLTFILMLVLSTDAGDYAVLGYRLSHHGLLLAPAAVVLLPLWVPAIILFPLIILLFPDGRLASRRWRWVLGFTRRPAPSPPRPSIHPRSLRWPITTSTSIRSGT